MLDAGQIMDDLIPISRQDGGVGIGNTGCKISDNRDLCPPYQGACPATAGGIKGGVLILILDI